MKLSACAFALTSLLGLSSAAAIPSDVATLETRDVATDAFDLINTLYDSILTIDADISTYTPQQPQRIPAAQPSTVS